eukprot:699165_1
MTARTNWASIARRITTKKQTKSLLKVQYSFESSAITDSKQDAIINIRTQKEATPDPADDFTMHNERFILTTETISQKLQTIQVSTKNNNTKSICSFISSAEQ